MGAINSSVNVGEMDRLGPARRTNRPEQHSSPEKHLRHKKATFLSGLAKTNDWPKALFLNFTFCVGFILAFLSFLGKGFPNVDVCRCDPPPCLPIRES